MHQQTQPSFRLDIQGLRAVAVLAVIGDHLLGWPSGGFVGVDIFFVISGFLITGILLREYEAKETISFKNFYIRRAKRILPAATLVLIISICVSYPLLGFDRTKDVIKDAIASFLFVGNWQFALHGIDYFRQDILPSPLQHYWSLSVEEQFYFIWPWFLLALLFTGARLFNWKSAHAKRVAGYAITSLSFLSLLWCFHETTTNPKFAYFSTFSRAWELGIGAIIASCTAPLSRMDETSARTLGKLGLMGILVSLWTISAKSSFPAPWALLPVVSTALVIASGCSGYRGTYLLSNPVSQYIGKISYSLYLWHFPIAILLQYVLSKASISYYTVGLGLMLLLSAISFRILEEPARKGIWFQWDAQKKLKGLSTGWIKFSSTIFVFAILSLLSTFLIAKLSLPETGPTFQVLVGRTRVNLADCYGAAALDPAHMCTSINPGHGVKPKPSNLTVDTQDAYTCYTFPGQALRACEYGSRKKRAKRVALIGDSHAAALLPALKPQLEALNWRLTAMTGNGCQWRDQTYRKNACAEVVVRRQERLISDQFDLIIATGIRSTPGTIADYISAIEPLKSRGQQIVVIEDVPDASPEALACIQRIGFSYERNCSTPIRFAYADEDKLATAARQLGLPVVSLRKFFCIQDTCPAAIGNVLVYRDTAAHITASYAATLGPYLVEAILNATITKSR
ncbi:acyltransferase family protein [Pigmentiphaga daeguensis]|uniref:acyltransferase family protein n=1 Tax=Pigmentiphaga daeguensis TaxID=414049 RepID=UPI0031D24E19